MAANPRQQRVDTLERVDSVNVFRAGPALAGNDAPSETATADRCAEASMIRLPRGTFSPDERFPDLTGGLGMLVLDGLLLRRVELADRYTLEVLGPGDLFRPFDEERDSYAVVSGEVSWWAFRPAKVAVLDATFARSMARYPEVIADLAGRLSRRSAASSLRLAIVREPRLTVRLHCMLWQLADRYGEPQPGGTWLHVPLCHMLLSWLVGAYRPATSRAINELERAGHLARGSDGAWWLHPEPPAGIADLALPAQRVAA